MFSYEERDLVTLIGKAFGKCGHCGDEALYIERNQEHFICADMHGQCCSEQNDKYRTKPRTFGHFRLLTTLYTNTQGFY